jgi:hypothetical protein
MEHDHEHVAENEDAKDEKMEASEGIWIVVKYDGTHGAIGRVQGHKRLNDKVRSQILHGDNKPLVLDIAFDYAEMFRPVPAIDPKTGQPIMGPGGPQMQMAREPLVTNNGFMFDECLTYVRGWIRLNFFDDMKRSDRQRYMEFRDSALKGAEERRLHEAGLVTANGIPPEALQRLPDKDGKPHFKLDLRGHRPPQ